MIIITLLEQLLLSYLDYKENEEIMLRRYKLKDTTYSVREDFFKETVEIRKKLWDQVKKLREAGKYAVIKYDKTVTMDFQPRRLCVFRNCGFIFQVNYYHI